jgi:hypothetical protein
VAIRLKLGGYETVQGDPLGRVYVGCFPRMTEDEAWEAGRGVWKMNREKASRQRFALIVGEGIVRAVAEITGYTEHTTATGERGALEGQLLPAGDPVRGAYLGQPDPVANGSRTPWATATCRKSSRTWCVPGPAAAATTDRDFLPGHDARAIQARVREMFGGSALPSSSSSTHTEIREPDLTYVGCPPPPRNSSPRPRAADPPPHAHPRRAGQPGHPVTRPPPPGDATSWVT